MKTKLSKVALIVVLLSFYGYVNANESDKLTITGQVVDYKASPVEGAEIAIINSEYYDGEYYTKVIAPLVKTDENGQFEVQADVLSQYNTFIVARKAGLAYAWDGLNYSRNTKGKGEFFLVLEKACTLTGKVVDHNGKAVLGARVQAVPKTSYMSRLNQRPIFGPKEWFTTETDSNGVFSFDYFSEDVSSDFNVKAPALNCTYKYTTHYQNCCGFEVWQEDIQLVLPEEGKIQGRVIEAETNKPVGGLELLLQADRDTEDILNRYLPITIVTDADGSFVCEGLPEGKNTIELAVEETQTPDWLAEPVGITVPPNELAEDIEVKVQKGEILEFIVRQYDTEQPLPDITVSTYKEDFSARSITNQQGITRQRVLPGEYQAYAGGDGYLSWQVNEPVIVKEGEVTSLEIELTKSPTISGTVVNAEGQPAEDIMITVHPFGDHIYTDKEGRFVAEYDERQTERGLYIIARDTKNSLAAIVHTMDLEKPVKLSLSPALTVKGKIADPNGNGIPAARMSLGISFAYCLSQLGTEILTDAQGLFEFKAIPLKQSDFNFWHSINSTGFAPKDYDRITIQAEPGATADVGTINLKPANLSVSGIVVDANGVPRPRAVIFVTGLVEAEQPEKRTATNQQGQFVIKGVSPDPIRLQANFDSDPGGAGFTTAQGGDKDIKIVLGQRLVHTPQQSLLGKSLPDTSELGVELEEAEDKAIVVCFFDYQQRPSRNTVLQLVAQEEDLKAKEIALVLVQASKIDNDTLDEWLESQNVSFPVGMIETDEEQIKFNWGVKSLPWLILTDTEHTVTTEGFTISELNEKF